MKPDLHPNGKAMLRHLSRGPSPLRRLRRFARNRSGVTAVEYELMAALIGLTIFGAVSAVGQGIRDTLYGQIVTALQNMGK
jgi:Flp pilus assembly pilin Flp